MSNEGKQSTEAKVFCFPYVKTCYRQPGMPVHAFNLSIWEEAGRSADLCHFEASLFYLSSSRIARAMETDPVCKQTKLGNNKNKIDSTLAFNCVLRHRASSVGKGLATQAWRSGFRSPEPTSSCVSPVTVLLQQGGRQGETDVHLLCTRLYRGERSHPLTSTCAPGHIHTCTHTHT